VNQPRAGLELVVRNRGFAIAALASALAYLLVVGAIAAIIPTPVFGRTVAPTASTFVFWVLSAALFGPLAASYLLPPAMVCDVTSAERSTTVGSLLSPLAVGCPVCNKLVVLALGASGAITYFQPAQPWIGALSVALLAYGIWARFELTPAIHPGLRPHPVGLDSNT
jgi:hypothetical protein